MTTSMKDVAQTLNGLVQTCRDGEEGLRLAGESTRDPFLQALLRELSEQRSQFALELENEVIRLGEVPVIDGTLLGSLHRGWINLKNAVVGADDAAIVAECERGEASAINAYQEAMETELPSSTHAVLLRQYSFLQSAYQRIRRIVQSHEVAHS